MCKLVINKMNISNLKVENEDRVEMMDCIVCFANLSSNGRSHTQSMCGNTGKLYRRFHAVDDLDAIRLLHHFYLYEQDRLRLIGPKRPPSGGRRPGLYRVFGSLFIRSVVDTQDCVDQFIKRQWMVTKDGEALLPEKPRYKDTEDCFIQLNKMRENISRDYVGVTKSDLRPYLDSFCNSRGYSELMKTKHFTKSRLF